jgi:hypothetical protein
MEKIVKSTPWRCPNGVNWHPGAPISFVVYQEHGIIGFDFGRFEEAKLEVENADYDFPFLSLLIHL